MQGGIKLISQLASETRANDRRAKSEFTLMLRATINTHNESKLYI